MRSPTSPSRQDRLTPDLALFIDNAIVPALLDRFLAEQALSGQQPVRNLSVKGFPKSEASA